MHAIQGKNILALLGVLFLISFVYTPIVQPRTNNEQTSPIVTLDGSVVHVIIADTEATQERGLGGRNGLAPNEGMLFVFPSDGIYPFWMKDTLFSIDIIWLDIHGTIVDMRTNVSPESYPEVFTPTASARYVLEVSAGYVLEHNIKIGDIATL